MLNAPTARSAAHFRSADRESSSTSSALAALPLLRTASLPLTLVLLALAAPIVAAGWHQLFGDIWWVLKNGEVIATQGGLSARDPFTFAAHTPGYMNGQWLSQLAYYGAYRVAGLEGLAVFNMVIAAATVILLLHAAWRRCGSLLAAAASTLMAELIAIWHLNPRAQTLAFLPFAATCWLLTRVRAGAGTLVGLAVVEAVWANLHGSFFLGPCLTAGLLIGALIQALPTTAPRAILRAPRTRFLVRALFIQAVASMANPYGPRLYDYVLRLSSDSFIREYATEWEPTNFNHWSGMWFFACLAATVVIIARTRRRVVATDVLVLGLFAVLGLQAVRNVVWWALVSGPVLAPYIAAMRVPERVVALGRSQSSGLGKVLRAAVIGLVVLVCSPPLRPINPFLSAEARSMVPANLPDGAATFLLAQPLPARVFAYQGWSSYLDWRLAPRYQLMVDVAFEAHPSEVWLDYMTIEAGHVSWEERLQREGVDVLFLSRVSQPALLDAVTRSPNWQSIYSDDLAVIYAHSTTAMEATL